MNKSRFDKKTFLDRHLAKIESILYQYGNELPYPVAEYFCKLFLPIITSKTKVTYDLFRTFAPYKRRTKFIFHHAPKKDNDSLPYYFVSLDGIKVSFPFNETFDEGDEFATIIANTPYGYNSELEWEDDDEKRIATCTIKF